MCRNSGMLSNYFSIFRFSYSSGIQGVICWTIHILPQLRKQLCYFFYLCLFNIFCYFVTPFVVYYISSTSIDRKKWISTTVHTPVFYSYTSQGACYLTPDKTKRFTTVVPTTGKTKQTKGKRWKRSFFHDKCCVYHVSIYHLFVRIIISV